MRCRHASQAGQCPQCGADDIDQLWVQIEAIFLISNPLQNRRINAMDTKMVLGQTASDYFLVMKLAFDEADMGKATRLNNLNR